MTTTARRYTLLASTPSPTSRVATYNGTPHVVVPVIALVGDIVVRPLNSAGPEFVPASVLSATPPAWDGRPVVLDHPNGGTTSANTPALLERHSFGTLFNTRYEGGKLKTEAWLDPARALKVGPEAVALVEAIQAGQVVEVSVGAFVDIVPASGIHNGQRYDFAWTSVVPDHLAILPIGMEGACSVEMGCGVPRAAAQGGPMADKPLPPSRTSPISRLWNATLAALGFKAAEMSDWDLREAIDNALRSAVPGFDWIVDVFQESSTVVYSTWLDDRTEHWRQSFSTGGDGAITLSDDKTAVTPVTQWEPLAAHSEEEEGGDPASPTGNPERGTPAPPSQGAIAAAQGEPMTKVNELVGRLIANAATPYVEQDREALTAFGENRLTAMCEHCDGVKAQAPAPVPAVDEKELEVEATPLTDDEWMAQAPESLRQLVTHYQTEEKTRRDELIATLSKGQDVFSADALAAKPTDELRSLVRLAKLAPDYSGRPLPVDRSTATVVPIPEPYTAALAARKAN